MRLHENKRMFVDAIVGASLYFETTTSIIEKDYYSILILKELNKKIPGLLFKGGTSLSKCFKIINRFSEDIDLSLDNLFYTQGNKRIANKTIIKVCDELGFKIMNREFVEKHSHANYNLYEIEYPIIFSSDAIKPFIKIEMVFIEKSYPTEIRNVESYIGAWMMNKGGYETKTLFDLDSFEMIVQTPERTLIDKVFAICDYYLLKCPERNSRHIYDIHKLLNVVNLKDTSLIVLVEKVREDRIPNKRSVSAKVGISIPKILKEIIDTEFYRKDYEEVTRKLTTEPVGYSDAIKSLNDVIESGIFE